MKFCAVCCLTGSAFIAFTLGAANAWAGEPAGYEGKEGFFASDSVDPANGVGNFSLANLRQGSAGRIRIAEGISLLFNSSASGSMPVRCSARALGTRHGRSCLALDDSRGAVWSYSSLDILLSDEVAAYVRTGRAFRIGADPLRSVGIIGSVDMSISDRPQVRFEHEAGFRASAFDGQIGLNIAAYYNKVKASQETLTLTTPTGTRYSTFINPTTVRNMGLEGDLTLRPSRTLAFYGSLAANREKFKLCSAGFCPGHARDIMQTQVNLGANYQHEARAGTLGVNFNLNWTDRGRSVSAIPNPTTTLFSRRSATTLDARVSLALRSMPIELYAYGRNLTDHRYMQHSRLTQDSANLQLFNAPRSMGVGLAMAF